MTTDDDEEQGRLANEWYDLKSSLMSKSLGPEHDSVLHSVLPYALGGSLDLYFFPNGLSGTAIATKELSEDLDDCSGNDLYHCYELVMFTRQELDLEEPEDSVESPPETSPFRETLRRFGAILNCIAHYSTEATLNPNQTCEFPDDREAMGIVAGRCLIFIGYARHRLPNQDTFGLLGLIEVFRSEMEFARKQGVEKLVARLKEQGHYPFSDLDRAPVV